MVDSATTAWINAVVAAGGAVSGTQQGRVDALIVGLKADSLFTVLDRMWLFAGESDAKQATIDIITLGVGTPHGTIPLTAGGYTGDGSSGYLSQTFNPSTAGGSWTQNSAHIGGYVTADRTSGSSQLLIGVTSGGTDSFIAPCEGGANVVFELNGGTYPSVASTNAKASWLCSRPNSSGLVLYKNGSSVSSPADTSGALANQTVYICANNSAGSPSGYSTDRIGSIWFGGGLNATQVSNLSIRINAYMTAWGVNVYTNPATGGAVGAGILESNLLSRGALVN